MSNLLLIFTVVFVLVIAMACVVGIVVMLGNIGTMEEPPWRKRRAQRRSAAARHLFRDVH
jgi:uncharacterized protein HemY